LRLSIPEILMNNKFIEILIHLLGHLREHDLDSESINELSDNLATRGYDEMDIAEAINWFLEKIGSHTIKSTEIVEQKDKSVRVLHDYERLNIPTEAYGYLLRLKAMSVITASEMEKVLDYFLLLGPNSASETEINEIIANILFEEY
jgi:uncharacterized protein Smg (DUF494 family)